VVALSTVVLLGFMGLGIDELSSLNQTVHAERPYEEEHPMMKNVVVALILLALAVPAFGKTHEDTFGVPCNELWAAVKDTLRNSGKYGIIGIDNSELTASYNIGGGLAGKRINSVVLNPQGATSCEMQTQTAYTGLVHNDAGDFKHRVEESLAKLKGSKPSEPAQPQAPAAGQTKEAATPSPAGQLQSIAIKSEPDGADITADGKYVGSTPSTVRLSPGDHAIKVEKSGFTAWERTISVSSDSEVTVSATLEKP
jgi:hypothetical protein